MAQIDITKPQPCVKFRAQGFPESYIIDRDADGRSYPKSAQVARCGTEEREST